MREIDEFPDDESHCEELATKTKDYEERSLTTEERDEIIRKYNDEHSIPRKTPDEFEKTGDCDTLVKECITNFDSLETSFRVTISGVSIRNIQIESDDDLTQIIKEQFPSFIERNDFDRMFDTTVTYLSLVNRFEDKEFVSSHEISELSASYQTHKEVIKGWLCENRSTRLLIFLNQALSLDESANLRKEIIEQLNGVTTFMIAQERLETYYLCDEVKSFPKIEKFKELSHGFFRFLDTLSEGGLSTDIARKSGTSKEDVKRWTRERQIPSYVRLAAMIPYEKPEDDFKWLPLKIETGGLGMPIEFIQVPVRNLIPEKIYDVLDQLQPIDSPEGKKHEEKFGKLFREYSLMYLLGAILSDGGINHGHSISSASIKLKASKKYEWGIDFGEGFCYCMERVGIERKPRYEGVTRQKNGTIVEYHAWRSENTPLIVWIENTLLGLRGSKSKTETPIEANWIHSLPHSWQVAFLQGVCDGHASLRSQKVGITSKVNTEFLDSLLRSMEIEPVKTEIRVEVHRRKLIRKMHDFPMFRYATGRQEQLSQIVALLDSTGYNIERPKGTRELIFELSNSGFSSGEISEKLWLEHSIAMHSGSIRAMIREAKMK